MTSLRDRTLAVAALQLPLGSADESENIAAVAALVEQAAGQGAQVILPPELFSGPYFCKQERTSEAIIKVMNRSIKATGRPGPPIR